MCMADEHPPEKPAVVKVFGRTGSPPCYAVRDFLYRNDIRFEWVEIRTDDQARALGLESAADNRLPVCVFADGTRLERPTIRRIAEQLGWFHDPSLSEYDLAIYGAGPAGLSAAVYGASEGLKTVVVERWAVGDRRGAVRRSRTTWDFRKASAGRSSLNGRARRPVNSVRRS